LIFSIEQYKKKKKTGDFGDFFNKGRDFGGKKRGIFRSSIWVADDGRK
jgi:hypothetical protein